MRGVRRFVAGVIVTVAIVLAFTPGCLLVALAVVVAGGWSLFDMAPVRWFDFCLQAASNWILERERRKAEVEPTLPWPRV